ncbi:MAG TPA: excinuclease ABC subunit UvrA, partial [Polyangiales bacterium]|nr:excinuclease ABC subunit UvrA [Polyangiales bacterium]
MSVQTGLVVVRGARQHNLKNIDVAFPRDRLVVISGPSGSGKSSLAFDTLYAEGQRRYVESLSLRARQQLARMPRPDVDMIDGLSPAIGVQASELGGGPRSTVGTVSEIHDLLRLLFARAGEQHCPQCGTRIDPRSVAAMVDRVLALPEGTRVRIQAPLLRKGLGAEAGGAEPLDLEPLFERLRREGYARVVLDGEVIDLGTPRALPRRGQHTLDVDIDRLVIKPGVRSRLADSIELALREGGNTLRVAIEGGEPLDLTTGTRCMRCGFALPELTLATFSFNSPAGACEKCAGLGERRRFDQALVVPDPQRSLRAGAIAAWGTPEGRYHARMLEALLAAIKLDADAPFAQLPARTRERILTGGKGYEGVLSGLERRRSELEARSSDDDDLDWLEQELLPFMRRDVCEHCHGARLNARALGVRIAGQTIADLGARQLDALLAWCEALQWPEASAPIAEPILSAVRARLQVILDLGLAYLSLNRESRSLSRGEAERIRLAAHLGAGLCGVLYVLDEPTTGLHSRDTARLLATLGRLRDRGNTVLVVEHDLDVIAAADHVIELGPGAGALGGHVLVSGTPEQVQATAGAPTAAYLQRRAEPPPARVPRPRSERWIAIRGARVHNLDGVDADLPIGRFSCVTGVSGSGKSSLVMHTLLPAARACLRGEPADVAATVSGLDAFERVVHVDQSPIGRTPRSNPATYSGLLGPIRELFAELPEARARGYRAERFSFNVKGGRCEACQGAGFVRVAMEFLPDAYVRCASCGGGRFDRETLEVRYRGRSIADVLASTVDEASELFGALPKLSEGLAGLRNVGLGYLQLGQSASSLSAGEAQRLRLGKELARRGAARTLYVLDEPSAGLHASEVDVLARVLQGLVDEGHTVVLVEHQLELVLAADYVLDLGPEGGAAGGRVLVAGTPADVAACTHSHTG